jgi:hypothetical protein
MEALDIMIGSSGITFFPIINVISTFFTLILILVVFLWFLARQKLIVTAHGVLIESRDDFFYKVVRGSAYSGIFLALSLIPLFGFIFLFTSAGFVSSYSKRVGIISHKLKTGPNSYVFVAAIAGFVEMIAGFADFQPFYTDPVIGTLVDLALPFFIAAAAAAILPFAGRYMGYFTVLVAIVLMLFNLQGATTVSDVVTVMTFSLLFLLVAGILYSERQSYIRKGGMSKDIYGTKKFNPAIPPGTATAGAQQQGTVPPRNVDTASATAYQQTVTMQSPSMGPTVPMTSADRKLAARDLIAMVGPPLSGKTTFLAYFFQFIAEIETKTGVSIEVNPGIELMEQYLKRIISEHKFPELTGMDKVGEVVFTFTRKKKIGKSSTHLRVSDIAGERFSQLQGAKESVRRQLTNTRFEYLLRARGYLIMVDCSSYTEWATKDLEYWRILNSLLSARLEKEPPRIAFVFTKTDTLPSAVASYDAIQLLEILKNTNLYIKKYVRNPSAFKIFIKTERSSDGQIVPKLDVDVGGRLDIKYDSEYNDGFLYVAQWIADAGGL